MGHRAKGPDKVRSKLRLIKVFATMSCELNAISYLTVARNFKIS